MKPLLILNSFKRHLAWGFLGLLLTSQLGCSVQGQITDLTQKTKISSLGQAVGIVSGAAQNMNVNNYTVSVTVGDFAGAPIQQTVNNYTIYTSVQGALSSDANEIQSH